MARTEQDLLEKYPQHLRPTDHTYHGIPLEVEGFDNWRYRRLIDWAERHYSGKVDIMTNSDLPQSGPALFVATHPGRTSTIVLPWAVMHEVHRPMQMVAKDTLIIPGKKESKKVLEKKGKSTDWKAQLGAQIENRLMGYPTRAANSLPIDQEHPSRESFRLIQQVFKNNGFVGFMAQGTRTEEHDISNIHDGVGVLMVMNPDVPVYPVIITRAVADPGSRYSSTISFGEQFTFSSIRDMLSMYPGSVSHQATLFVADRWYSQWKELNPDGELLLPEDLQGMHPSTTIVNFGRKVDDTL